MQALKTRATELLFGGASEGGKSMFIRLALIMWCAAIPGLQCRIIRKYFRDVVANHMKGPFGFKALLKPWIQAGLVKCTEREVRFWNGSIISLGSLLYDKDFEKEQGIEKHVLVVDEATQVKGRYVDGLRGWVRMPREMKDLLPAQLRGLYPDMPAEQLREMFPRIIYTANPIGVSVGYFRREFVKARPVFEIEKVGAFLRQYIPSLVTDNFSADADAQRERLTSLGEQIAQALITGDWDSPVGDFFKEFDERRHVVPDHTPPTHLFKYRTLDLGYAEPFAVYWWYVSDGEEFMDRGRRFWFPRGALVAYREWYGCNPENPEEGIRMRNDAIAQGILSRTSEQTTGITLTDSLPFQDRGMGQAGKKYVPADIFFEEGCPLTKGNTARIHGWSQVRDRLIGKGDFPMIYFTESCKAARDYLPAIETDPNNREDAVDSGEATHSPDAIRLACTARPMVKEKPMPTNSDSFKVTLTPKTILSRLKKQQRRHAGR